MLFLVAYYGLFAALMGGLAAALDATAGERERQSLEPLLTTPLHALELATGKWAAVVALDAVVVVLTLSGFYSRCGSRRCQRSAFRSCSARPSSAGSWSCSRRSCC